METIINFFEQYWGVTLFGSITVGTLITFIVVQAKSIISNKFKGTQLDTATIKLDQLCNELNNKSKENEHLQNKMNEQSQYFEQVQAATFQAISYLVVASKLPTEDKLALQEKFTNLIKDKKVEYTEMIKEEIVPDVVASVTQTVSESKSLLDKYMTEE